MNQLNLEYHQISVKPASGLAWVGARYSTLLVPTLLHPGYTLPRGSAVLHHGYTLPSRGVNIAVGLKSVAQVTSRPD